MKVIKRGHTYELEGSNGHTQELQFVCTEQELGLQDGTHTQEVLRALIDRTQHCDRCLRWEGNDKIIQHLRMALVLHEARALERKTLKGYMVPELIAVDPTDAHFKLSSK